MGTEDTLKYFINIIGLLANIKKLLKDDFFAGNLDKKVTDLSSGFFNLVREGEKDNVAQYQIQKEKCFYAIDSLTEFMKELKYLSLIEDHPLLLEAERYLLVLRLEIIKDSKARVSKPIIKAEVPGIVKEETVFSRPRLKERKSSKMTVNKKKIFDFIKSYPNTRTKDIIFEFNALSNRTVKRNLTDLLRTGLVKKRIDNKAVYYYASE